MNLVWKIVCLALLVIGNSAAFAQSAEGTTGSEAARYNALDNELQAVEAGQTKLRSQSQRLRETIRELEAQIRQAQSRPSQNQRKLQNLHGELVSVQTILGLNQIQLIQITSQVRNLQDQLKAAEAALRDSWIDRLPANFGLNGVINYPIDGNLDLGFGAAATLDFNITDTISIGGKVGYTRIDHKDGLVSLRGVPITATMTIAGSTLTSAVAGLILPLASTPTTPVTVKGEREWWCTAEAGVMLIQNVGDGPSTENGLLIGASCGMDFSVTKHITVSPCLGGYVTTAEGAGGTPHSLTLSCSLRFEPCQR